MSILYLEENGEVFVKMPLTAYQQMQDTVDVQEAEAIRARIRSGEAEAWPSEVIDRLIEGETPIKVIREWRGLTLQSVAGQAEVPLSVVSGIEEGTEDPRLGTLRKLAEVLKVDVDDLVGW
ncbi:helix-turn-helix domain-containing protein [Terasakiella pusilla]|uniref:helix-turn-helix domain-containing protein n=1 Tax=Terasakiella pusilla TaxID=64973 RepID=UPI003AA827A1